MPVNPRRRRTLLGKALKGALKERGLKQEQLAHQLDINPSVVSRWVTGKHLVPEGRIDQVCEILQAPQLRALLDSERKQSEHQDRHDLFLATPMAALPEEEYARLRQQTLEVVQAIEAQGANVYWAGREIGDHSQFDPADMATINNLNCLRNASSFVYLQLAELNRSTSALIELGLALGWEKPVTILTGNHEWLPYMLEEFSAVAERLDYLERVRIYSIRSPKAIIDKFERYGLQYFGIE